MKKVIISNIKEQLIHCTCSQGCHICSGTNSAFPGDTMEKHYMHVLDVPGHYGYKNFHEYLKNGAYGITDEAIEELETKHGAFNEGL